MIEFESYREPRYCINDGKSIIIGRTEPMLDLFMYLNQLAQLDTRVLLRGDTGTGKELCARALHFNGGEEERRGHNFVAVNCAGIPAELLESNLFGHVKGAFTGAYQTKEGSFQHANNGTILLDEIGDMSLTLQAKVLRVLQENQVTKVGSNKVEDINVRIIAATNKNLEEEVLNGRFREDLYYRLNVVPVTVPKLNDRVEDIPLIAEHLVDKFNRQYGMKLEGLSDEAKEKLMLQTWKGNVRELENVIERVFVLRSYRESEGVIQAEDIYLNSEMPTNIFRRNQNGSVRIFQPVEESQPKLWFHNGVLPMTTSELTKLDGSKEYLPIKARAEKNDIYSVEMAFGDTRKYQLFYLTPDNLDAFFKDISTEDYQTLEHRIKTGVFNTVASEHFRFFSMKDLIDDPNTFATRDSINHALADLGLYEINVGKGKLYAVTVDSAKYFVRQEHGRYEKITRFQETIKSAYDEFTSWQGVSYLVDSLA